MQYGITNTTFKISGVVAAWTGLLELEFEAGDSMKDFKYRVFFNWVVSMRGWSVGCLVS